jgi:C4-dicarboxylate-specific signal transduction histidine kinase/uncharacterized membrane protein affecting hemolysin expression
MRNIAIKYKLISIIMATCLAVLLLAGIILLIFEQKEYREETINSISCYAEIIGDNCRAALAFEDAEDATETLKSLKAESSIVFACVYTKEGKVLAHYQHPSYTEGFLPPEYEKECYRFHSDYFELYKQIKENDELIGTVYIKLDLSHMRTLLWLKAGTIAMIVLACSLVAYLVSLRLQKVISGPILSLAEVARSVSEKKDYSTRALKQNNDEIGSLIDDFNEMLEQIQQRDSALTDAKNKLETRVRERTAELSLAYKRTEGLNHLKSNLLSTTGLNKQLKCITDALVDTFDADFARIWLIKGGDRCDSGCVHAKAKEEPYVCRYRDRCLHLTASSGRYTHIDGQIHRRIPLGNCKIGRIASGQDCKFLTNDVTHDPHVHDHDWARDLGLVSFAGYKLASTTGECVGVLALFSKHVITDEEDAFIEGVANTTTQVIQMAMAEEELQKTHQRLVEASHRAGMAEVAADVLHNVGNVLNSINVSTTVIIDKVKESEVVNLGKVVRILNDHIDDLGNFLTENPQGKNIPIYLTEVSKLLINDQTETLGILRVLSDNVQHIKDIISMQQSYAKVSGVEITTSISGLVEDAIQINSAGLQRHGTRVIREFEELPDIQINKQKMLQVLVNLISNAKYALSDSKKEEKIVTIRIYKHQEDRFRIEVADNGVGISKENLTKIFSHGFTTKKHGHGFGLHSSALASKEMGGTLTVHSDGLEQGATFTLELPFKSAGIIR